MLKMKEFEGEKAQFLPDQTYTSKMTILRPRPGPRRALSLRRRPHQRRHDRRLSGASRRPHRRSLREASDAWHRRRQWRQRRRLSRDAANVRKSHSGRRHRDSRPHGDDDHVEGVRGVRRVQRGVPGRGRGRPSTPARPSTRPSRGSPFPKSSRTTGCRTPRTTSPRSTPSSSLRRQRSNASTAGRCPKSHIERAWVCSWRSPRRPCPLTAAPADTLRGRFNSKKRPSRRFTPR